MPEHLRALIIILILATTFFSTAHRVIVPITDVGNYTRRRNLWFYLTLAAFLAYSFWVYIAIAIPLLTFTNRRDSNPPALFFFILFALPVATIQIPGMGLVNYFFELSHARILELFILLPAFFVLQRQNNNISFGRNGPDKALAAYLLLTIILTLQGTTLTDSMRNAFYLFIDVFLPYYVMSRSPKNLQSFRDVLLSFILAVMVVGMLAVFETYRHWILYDSLIQVLKLEGMTGYLGRDGILRAVVTAGQAIPLGYIMVVGMGFYLYLKDSIQNKFIRRLGMLVLAAGLIAPFSRGPWVGAALLLVVFFATGRNAVRHLVILAIVTVLALALVSILPGGEKVINLLPFIGSTESGNVTYRQNLITNSMIVIQRNPWFGSADFLATPEMEAMRQGEGIIDIVNSYIGITLAKGFVGLGLFVGFFASVLIGVNRAIRSLADKNSEEHLLGRALLATIMAILLIIFTVSSIGVIPIVFWSVAGLGVAYAQMIREGRKINLGNLSVVSQR